MKSFFNFISSRKVISIIIVIFLCGMLVAKTRGNRLPENGMDNRSVPNLIDYQGKFTDDSSNPITGNVEIVFAVYADSTGGTALWTETHSSVEALDGLVHVLMGSETSFGDDLFEGSDRWLSINVNGDGEMTPRLRIVSVPYAIHANDSDNLNGNDSSYFMPASTDNWVDITGDTMTGNLVVNADFQATGITRDSGGDAGTSGQVLSTTGTGTDWVNAACGAEEIDDLSDGKTGGYSVFLGHSAGLNDDGTDNRNVGVGNYALYTNTDGNNNTASGYQALVNNSTGSSNTANGSHALHYNTGSNNIAFGMNALYSNTSGEGNVGIGLDANAYNQEGSNNTIIGFQAGMGTSLHNKSGNVFLGYYAGHSEIGDNKLYIENSDADSTGALIWGDFDNDKIVINGEFQATGITRDSGGDEGTSEQVLSSTATGTDWVDAATGDITAVTAGTGLTGGGTSGNVTLNVDLAGSGSATTVSRSDHNHFKLDAADGDPTNVVYVDNEGDVRIGNGTSTLYKLDVDGDVNISTGNAYKISGYDIMHCKGSDNTFLGRNSGTSISTGNLNTFMGYSSGMNNDEGVSNTFIGYFSGEANTTGYNNTFIGRSAGPVNTDGDGNVFLGMLAGRVNESGNNNTFLGYRSGYYNVSGSNNVFLGYRAGYNETESNKLYIANSSDITPLIYGEFDNDYIKINGDFEVTGILYDDDHDAGTSGQVLSSTGSGTDWVDENVGAEEIDDLTDGKTGGNSVFLGSGAGTSDDGTDNDNVGIGFDALNTNTDGYSNTASGCQSLYTNSTGHHNTANGYQALINNSTGNYNTANGAHTLHHNTGSNNTAFGSYALSHNTSGGYNVGIGLEANVFNEEGSNNTIIGYQAGRGTSYHNKTGNIFLGYQAGYNETRNYKLYIESSNNSTPLIYGEFDNDYVRINGDFQATGELRDSDDQPGTSGQVLSSIATGTDWVDENVGAEEIDDLTDGKTGGYSVFLGSNAGLNDDGISNYNVGVGVNALRTNISGTQNTANGYYALYNNTESYNTAFGSYALYSNTSGVNNVGIGIDANRYNQTGSQNTIIGYKAGRGTSNHSKSGNVFLGYHAGYSETGDDKLYIANSSDSTPLIKGDFSTDKVTINDVLILAPRSSAPSSPTEGELYVNSSNHHIYCYLNGSWKQLD